MWNKFGLKVLAVLTALVMVVSCAAVLYSGTEAEKGISEGGGRGVISLMPPPFIGVAGAAEAMGGGGEGAGASAVSLSNEVGISAYLNAGSIDLNQARTAYKSIDTETPEYIIGIVQISGVDESLYPRVYTNKNGWILAYLTQDEPASAIVQWQGYIGGAITRTTLEDGITKVCNAAGKNYTRENVSYYDFRFPEANRMLWVVERVQAPLYTNSFDFTIQNELTVYNGSWSYDSDGGASDYLEFDGNEIAGGEGQEYGYYNTTTQLEKGTTHVVSIRTYHVHPYYVQAATIITYKVPT
ncbi:MAG TPA: hypothetical protein C5S37_03685 [Methanophagales archaeon]|nr:hypothetical protein [Methanophagales archaeon]